MPKLESIIKSEIQRLATRQIRSVFLPLRKEVRAMRLKLSTLSKAISLLEHWGKELARQKEMEKPKLEASPEEVKASRLTPDRIARLRKKLGISQRELGVLTGASLGAVASWERGKFKPQGAKKAALVVLRKVRKRDVKKMLTEKVETKVKAKGRRPKIKTRRKKSRKLIGKRK